jgi:hypothetical protein
MLRVEVDTLERERISQARTTVDRERMGQVNRQAGACRVCPGYEKIETISIRLDDGEPKV